MNSVYMHCTIHHNYSIFSHQDGCPEQPASTCGNVGPVTWPETEIGQVASVPCRCGLEDPLIKLLRGTRRCGGTYEGGAVWEEPQCDSCIFSKTRRTLCELAEVGSHRGRNCGFDNVHVYMYI